ncbi:MAG: type II CAAX prenyl endopeptidase Rce1 family protein, partial [Planctomycetota bacterium]
LVIFPVLLGYEWLLMPADLDLLTAADWAVMLGLAGLAVAFVWRDRRHAVRLGLGARNFLPAARLLAAPTVLMAAASAAMGAWAGTPVRPAAAVLSVATYPLYAVIQLALFQLFLVPRLRRLSANRLHIVVAAAGIFALIHWPNPVVMAATALGGVVWTLVYLHRPNLYALALAMGIAAAVFAHALPDGVTHNMRTGPIYVLRLIERAGAS